MKEKYEKKIWHFLQSIVFSAVTYYQYKEMYKKESKQLKNVDLNETNNEVNLKDYINFFYEAYPYAKQQNIAFFLFLLFYLSDDLKSVSVTRKIYKNLNSLMDNERETFSLQEVSNALNIKTFTLRRRLYERNIVEKQGNNRKLLLNREQIHKLQKDIIHDGGERYGFTVDETNSYSLSINLSQSRFYSAAINKMSKIFEAEFKGKRHLMDECTDDPEDLQLRSFVQNAYNNLEIHQRFLDLFLSDFINKVDSEFNINFSESNGNSFIKYITDLYNKAVESQQDVFKYIIEPLSE